MSCSRLSHLSRLKQVSIVIPLAADETQHKTLLEDLSSHSELQAEIITCSKKTRAESLNCASNEANGEWLWFVHADSRISADNISALETSLSCDNSQDTATLYYFDLGFDDPSLRVNALGANLRSGIFGTPFGDQGFCIKQSLFQQLGGYPENTTYGEDLLFVWRARQAGVKLKRIPSSLVTSGRKYRDYGWLKLTLLYQWRWISMSCPEFLKLVSLRIKTWLGRAFL